MSNREKKTNRRRAACVDCGTTDYARRLSQRGEWTGAPVLCKRCNDARFCKCVPRFEFVGVAEDVDTPMHRAVAEAMTRRIREVLTKR